MTLIDGLTTGWHHSLWLLGYAAGALPVVTAAALALTAGALLGARAIHLARVARIRRADRRFGRNTAHVPGSRTGY